MSATEESEILALVVDSGLPRRKALAQLRLAKSTYYHWLKRQAEGRLPDRKGASPIPWNKLKSEEEERILAQARGSPEPSARQLALSILNCEGMNVLLNKVTIWR